MANRKSYHVLKSSNGSWAVKSSSSRKSIGKFKTQREAISNARKIAKNRDGVLYIHRIDGMVRERRNYSDEPFPKNRRVLGEAKGKVWMSEDFDEEFAPE